MADKKSPGDGQSPKGAPVSGNPRRMTLGQEPEDDDLNKGQEPEDDDLNKGQEPEGDDLNKGQEPEGDDLNKGQEPEGDDLNKGQEPADDGQNKGSDVESEESRLKRLAIEEAMTNAMIRRCNGCGVAIVRIDGCNHVVCSRCGTEMCYICRKTLRNEYWHFDTLCPQYTNNKVVHEDAVAKAEKEAKEKLEKPKDQSAEEGHEPEDVDLNKGHEPEDDNLNKGQEPEDDNLNKGQEPENVDWYEPEYIGGQSDEFSTEEKLEKEQVEEPMDQSDEEMPESTLKYDPKKKDPEA